MVSFFRVGSCIFCFLLFCLSMLYAQPLDVTLQAKEAILINAESGKVLFEKDAHKPAFPASITKIATALFVLDKYHNRLDEMFSVSKEALRSLNSEEKRRREYASPAYWLEEGSRSLGLLVGEKETLRSLLGAMLIASGNDASNVVAEGIGGTIPHFMEGMQEYLKEIGCEKSCFKNPHGLHHPLHVTTAFEMAEMTRRAMKIDEFQKIVSSLFYTHGTHSFSQTNRLMKKGKYFYPYAIGVKTGHTSRAEYNLVAAAEKEGRRLIAVLMGCGESVQCYEDAQNLFEAAFREKKRQKTLLQAPKTFQMKIEGAKTLLQTSLAEDVTVTFYPSEEEPLSLFLHWKTPLLLPIAKGAHVATIELFSAKKEKVMQIPLFAKEDVSPTFFHQWKEFFSSFFGDKKKDEKMQKR